jgi:hypothetical protein
MQREQRKNAEAAGKRSPRPTRKTGEQGTRRGKKKVQSLQRAVDSLREEKNEENKSIGVRVEEPTLRKRDGGIQVPAGHTRDEPSQSAGQQLTASSR